MYSHKKFELSRKMKLGVGRAYSRGQMMKYSSFGFLIISAILGINAIRLYTHQPSKPQPQVLGAYDKAQATNSAADTQYIEHKVKKGQTLFSIAQQYNIPWTTLATLNNMQPPFQVQENDTLQVPRQ